MISVEEYKKSLGSLVGQLSEEQILKKRERHDQMAEVLFASWLDKIKQDRNAIIEQHDKEK